MSRRSRFALRGPRCGATVPAELPRLGCQPSTARRTSLSVAVSRTALVRHDTEALPTSASQTVDSARHCGSSQRPATPGACLSSVACRSGPETDATRGPGPGYCARAPAPAGSIPPTSDGPRTPSAPPTERSPAVQREVEAPQTAREEPGAAPASAWSTAAGPPAVGPAYCAGLLQTRLSASPSSAVEP